MNLVSLFLLVLYFTLWFDRTVSLAASVGGEDDYLYDEVATIPSKRYIRQRTTGTAETTTTTITATSPQGEKNPMSITIKEEPIQHNNNHVGTKATTGSDDVVHGRIWKIDENSYATETTTSVAVSTIDIENNENGIIKTKTNDDGDISNSSTTTTTTKTINNVWGYLVLFLALILIFLAVMFCIRNHEKQREVRDKLTVERKTKEVINCLDFIENPDDVNITPSPVGGILVTYSLKAIDSITKVKTNNNGIQNDDDHDETATNDDDDEALTSTTSLDITEISFEIDDNRNETVTTSVANDDKAYILVDDPDPYFPVIIRQKEEKFVDEDYVSIIEIYQNQKKEDIDEEEEINFDGSTCTIFA